MCPLTSIVGLTAIGGYIYVGALFGRVSLKAGNGYVRAVLDALMWPLMAWVAIEKLYKYSA